jgi:hypothetical protein
MKKPMLLLLAALMLTAAAGCSQPFTLNAGFTKEDEAVLAVTDSGFQYRYSGGNGYRMTLWMERYEYGELVQSTPDILSFACADTGKIIFYSNLTDDADDETLNIAVVAGDESSPAGWALDLMPMNEGSGTTLAGPGNISPKAGDNIVLVYYGFSPTMDTGLPLEFYENYQAYLSELEEIPAAVLIGCKVAMETA